MIICFIGKTRAQLKIVRNKQIIPGYAFTKICVNNITYIRNCVMIVRICRYTFVLFRKTKDQRNIKEIL